MMKSASVNNRDASSGDDGAAAEFVDVALLQVNRALRRESSEAPSSPHHERNHHRLDTNDASPPPQRDQRSSSVVASVEILPANPHDTSSSISTAQAMSVSVVSPASTQRSGSTLLTNPTPLGGLPHSQSSAAGANIVPERRAVSGGTHPPVAPKLPVGVAKGDGARAASGGPSKPPGGLRDESSLLLRVVEEQRNIIYELTATNEQLKKEISAKDDVIRGLRDLADTADRRLLSAQHQWESERDVMEVRHLKQQEALLMTLVGDQKQGGKSSDDARHRGGPDVRRSPPHNNEALLAAVSSASTQTMVGTSAASPGRDAIVSTASSPPRHGHKHVQRSEMIVQTVPETRCTGIQTVPEVLPMSAGVQTNSKSEDDFSAHRGAAAAAKGRRLSSPPRDDPDASEVGSSTWRNHTHPFFEARRSAVASHATVEDSRSAYRRPLDEHLRWRGWAAWEEANDAVHHQRDRLAQSRPPASYRPPAGSGSYDTLSYPTDRHPHHYPSSHFLSPTPVSSRVEQSYNTDQLRGRYADTHMEARPHRQHDRSTEAPDRYDHHAEHRLPHTYHASPTRSYFTTPTAASASASASGDVWSLRYGQFSSQETGNRVSQLLDRIYGMPLASGV